MQMSVTFLTRNDFTVLTSYHTHGAHSEEADAEVSFVEDLEIDFSERIYGYIATPGGHVWFND